MATPRLNAKTADKIRNELEKGKSHRAIAKELGVSTGTVANVRSNRGIDDLLESKRANAQGQLAEERYKEAVREIERLRKEMDAVKLMDSYRCRRKPVEIKARTSAGGKGEATAVVCANDWHVEEKVDRAAVNGVNEYNLAIAKSRIERFWCTAASLVDMCRSRSRIDTVVVNLMGDFITGYLHEELTASNEATPAEAVLLVYDYLIDGLEHLRRETKAKLVVPCVCGNHGRFTQKKWSKLGPGTNFEYILYAMIAKWFRGREKEVEVLLPQGEMTYIKLYGRTIRVMHGDSIRYAGGVGGIHIPLRKAIDAWNTVVRADYNYLGHWHTEMTGEDYRLSGSLIGFNEYSVRIKARFARPSQAFGLMHPNYGATANFPIILD